MIGNGKWYLGPAISEERTSTFYYYERSTTVNWIGKVGLICPSDYGYATSGGSSINRTTCTTRGFDMWDNDCIFNDWLSDVNWTISPVNHSSYVFYIISKPFGSSTSNNHGVRPTIYLKSTIKITGGTGSSTDPFILG